MDGLGADAAAREQLKQDAPSGLDSFYEESEARQRWRRRLTIATIIVTLIAAAAILPPLVNIGRYKHQVTSLMTRSLGRPVRMSSVGLRLLPMPGFVIHDLSVSEDPQYGAEPVLSAGSVVARVNLFSLWRGKLEISRIVVDEASLNLVRAGQGRWNIGALMMGAQPALTGLGESGKPVPQTYSHFPYLEATNSRVNVKYGDEKKPIALTGTDLSLWQDEPGQWRFRLKGQPVRTDIQMNSADAGELRAEGSLRSAASLREMPLTLQIEWREAQVGQLSRLLVGSDSGWRGDVTADIEVHGTAENAQTRARLRVLGIRREDVTSKTSLAFEANCTLRYQHSVHAVHDLACDTDSGGGQIHLRADLPGAAGNPSGKVEIHEVPLQGGLDLLRAMRSGFAPGLSVTGNINGSLVYAQPAPPPATPDKHAANSRLRTSTVAKAAPSQPTSELQGDLTIEGARLESDSLKEPLVLPHISWTPVLPVLSTPVSGKQRASVPVTAQPSEPTLATRFVIPIGTGKAAPAQPSAQSPTPQKDASDASTKQPQPSAAKASTSEPQINDTGIPAHPEPQSLTVQLALSKSGYEAQIDGAGNIARLRELAYALGSPHLDAVEALSGSADQLSIRAAGPWFPSSDLGAETSTAATPAEEAVISKTSVAPGISRRNTRTQTAVTTIVPIPVTDSISGTVSLRHAVWSPSFLISPVSLNQASLVLSLSELSFASEFSLGAARELAKTTPPNAETEATVPPSLGSIHGSVVVNSPLTCSTSVCRPQVQLNFATLNAADLQSALLNAPSPKGFLAPLIDRMRPATPAKLPDFDAQIQVASLTLGPLTFPFSVKLHPQHSDFVIESWNAGILNGTAEGTGSISMTNGKPAYSIEGSFKQVNGSSLGTFAGIHGSGGAVSGNGHVDLSGLTEKDLASSSSGELHFDWRAGTLLLPAQPGPASLRFDDWSGVANLSSGKAELGTNSLVRGKETTAVSGSIPFGEPAKLAIPPGAKATAQTARLVQ